MEFCTERGLCVGNTYFEYRYTSVARGQDGVEIKNIIDPVLVKKDMLHYVQDVKAVRGMDEISQITMLYCVKSGWWSHGLRGLEERN